MLLYVSFASVGPYSYILTRNERKHLDILSLSLLAITGLGISLVVSLPISLMRPLILLVIIGTIVEHYSFTVRSLGKYFYASLLRDHLVRLLLFLILVIFSAKNISFYLNIILSLTLALAFILNIWLKLSKLTWNLDNSRGDIIFLINTNWIVIIFLVFVKTSESLLHLLFLERGLRLVSAVVSQYTLSKQLAVVPDTLVRKVLLTSIVLALLSLGMVFYDAKFYVIAVLVTMSAISWCFALKGYLITGNYLTLRALLIIISLVLFNTTGLPYSFLSVWLILLFDVFTIRKSLL